MAKLNIEPNNAKRSVTSLGNLEQILQGYSDEVESVRSALDYKIAGQEQIRVRLSESARLIAQESGRTAAMKDALEQIIQRYEQTENANLGRSAADIWREVQGAITNIGPLTTDQNGMDPTTNNLLEAAIDAIAALLNDRTVTDTGGTPSMNPASEIFRKSAKKALETMLNGGSDDEDYKTILNWVKSWLEWADKEDVNDKAGLGKDGIAYLQSLYQFFTGGMRGESGAKDWLDLSSKSVDLWKGFYDYLKDFYNGVGEAFSKENISKVGQIGIFGGALGWLSDLCGAVDNIKNSEGMGPSGMIGEFVDTLSNGVDIWSGIETLIHAGDKAENITTVGANGVVSPLKIYTTIAKGYIAAFAQGFKSIDEYSADGVWDAGDTGALGIDFASKGLYTMVNSFHKMFTFGLSLEDTTGVSAEDVSSGLKDMAGGIGTDAGEYILNNKSLHEAYENAGGIGQTAIIFYSAIVSRFKK